MKPAAKSHKVAVIGGGPGGMETARIATLRGHRVTIFERTGELGGAILSCCTVPGKNVKMRWYADWLRREMDKLNVEVKYRTVPRIDVLKKYDVVIVATGGKVARPDIPGIDRPFVTTFEDVLRCSSKKCEYYPKDKGEPVECGNTVLVWGDHYGAVDAVERLGGLGKKGYVVTENPDFAEWLEPCHRDVMMKRLAGGNGEALRLKRYKHAATIIANSSVLEIRKDGEVVIVDNEFKRRTLKVDTVVLANVEPNDGLYQKLLDAGLAVTTIGDAKAVRNLRSAVTEGANVGLTLDDGALLNANAALISSLPTGITL
jgi:NADPH-dependent glutamate synthase beta subunit-like oxidoreductase